MNPKTADLTYRKDGLFVRFYAETKAGESAWNEMAKHCGGVAAVLASQFPAVRAQLAAAGYTIRRAPPAPSLASVLADLDKLLA